MDRRTFISDITFGLLAAALRGVAAVQAGSGDPVKVAVLALTLAAFILPPAHAQPQMKPPRIGVLRAGQLPPTPDPALEAFRQGLRGLGWIEGQNLAIEYRWAEGRPERLPELAAELVRLNVKVIVTATEPAIRAAKQATSTIPIVMAAAGDPVATGLVVSLARPGGNVTGLSNLGRELEGKRMELVKEVLPRVTRVALVWDPANRTLVVRLRETQAAAQRLGLQLLALEVRETADLKGAFETAVKEGAGALILTAPIASIHRNLIKELIAQYRLPVIHDAKEWMENGGLMAYGASNSDLFRRAATYVDKILKGAKPGDLPIEQPTKFELVINLKTAKALGLTIPQSLLLRADQVIE
jgi:putative ABC transport system substrate-binding protein